MNIAIAAPSPVPFFSGGAESFWRGLHDAFREHTPHHVELIKVPVREFSLPDLMTSYQSFWQLDLRHFDMVVTSKYPAWMTSHPNHVVYLQHTLRGLYDSYHLTGLPLRTPEPVLGALRPLIDRLRRHDGLTPDELFDRFFEALAYLGAEHAAFTFPGPLARELVHWLDSYAMAPARIQRYLTLSHTVRARADYFPDGARVDVVPHPPENATFWCGDFGDVFTASRIDAPKRIRLLVEAMDHVRGDIRMRIAGTGPELAMLRALASHDPRIEFLGHVSREDLLNLYAGSLVVPFVPVDEDMGLITQEAMLSGKPVLTTLDAGGAAELVDDGLTGLIVPPTARAIGTAIDRFAGDPAMARAMGAAGRRRAREVTWRRVVDAMLGRDQGADTPARPDSPFNHFTGRPRIVVLSTYRISGAVFGGPLRCRHLYSGLLPRYDVHIVSLAASGTPRQTVEISRGLVEEVVPLNDAVLAAECAAWPNSDTPITDVAASVFHHLVPQFGETVRRAVRGARGIVLAHPYLYPAIVGVGAGLPVIYDAHNAEFAMKRAMYPPTATGARLAAAVHTVEKAACATAALITPCAEGDADVLAQEFHVPRTHMVIVPNGVDTEAVRFVTTEERRTARERWIAAHSRGTATDPPAQVALFVGSWHQPNLEAAELIMAMAPHMPKVLFVIAGHVCERYRDWSVPTNVALVGIVSEATKNILLGMASVALNPMLQGGGSNLKLMEYMAAGVPVVTTTLGARGAGAEVNKHVVVAEMSDFSEAIESVFATPRATESRVEGARAMVEAHLDWRVLGKQFADAVDATINRADATSDASAAGTIEPMFPPAAVGAEPNSRS